MTDLPERLMDARDAMRLAGQEAAADLLDEARVEMRDLRVEIERFKSDRLYVLGVNHGYQSAMEQKGE